MLKDSSILLLAGGRGARMGGQDKGWVRWRGRALIEHMHLVVRPLTDDLIISCNRNQADYRPLADQLVSDPAPDYPGPLIGIIEALKIARHPYLLVLPCDAPLIDRPLLQLLVAQAGPRPLMLHHGGHWQPLFSLIPLNLLASLELQWRRGQRSPLQALLQLNPLAVELASHDRRLDNFNEPAMLNQPLEQVSPC
jgi:molybdopterin-guanine dinucleotide biosynthesis protein A